VARRPLPAVLTGGTAAGAARPRRFRPVPGRSLAAGRDLARTVTDSAADVLHPLAVLGRGLRRQLGWLLAWWRRTAGEKRGTGLLLAAALCGAVALLPYGPYLAAVAVLGAAGWMGRDRAPAPSAGPGEAEAERLTALYEALVPYLAADGEADPLYARDGDWSRAFPSHTFEAGRLTRLHLRYPAHFTDGEEAARTRVEQVLHAKAGRGREYRFDWNEEENHLTLTALPPLRTGIAAQRFVTSPGETVLGFTGADAVQRTVPVTDADTGEAVDAPPVVWRTGPRSTEPHLLVLGTPGAGATTLLRSVALQALAHGDLLVVDGGGTGEFAFLRGRPGVLGVESTPGGAIAALEWVARETERRLVAVDRARHAGLPVPEDARRPLWVLADRPGALARPVPGGGAVPDPQRLLEPPLRHGRAAGVTVAVAEQLDAVDAVPPGAAWFALPRTRVLLGPVSPGQVRAVLGAAPHTTPAAEAPPGRGYARLGAGPVLRLQVPATPDPRDEEAPGAHRDAVLALLPGEPPRPPRVRLIKTLNTMEEADV
jgi:hypothetical protein